MIVAIHQPNYMPWAGYFNKMKQADCFVLLDNVQVPDRSVANRNYIKGKNGKPVLLTVPLKKTKFGTYNNTVIDYSKNWPLQHCNKIKDAYSKAPFFDDYFGTIEQLLHHKYSTLSELNSALILYFIDVLHINTPIKIASDLELPFSTKNEQNIAICEHLGAHIYLSGKGAKKYNDHELYAAHQLEIRYQSFVMPQYQQLNNSFVSNLSIIDVLFNCGAIEAAKII